MFRFQNPLWPNNNTWSTSHSRRVLRMPVGLQCPRGPPEARAPAQQGQTTPQPRRGDKGQLAFLPKQVLPISSKSPRSRHKVKTLLCRFSPKKGLSTQWYKFSSMSQGFWLAPSQSATRQKLRLLYSTLVFTSNSSFSYQCLGIG